MTGEALALLERDHARLVQLLADVEFLAHKGSALPAAKVFGEFRRAMEQHLDREEKLLAELAREGVCPDVEVRRNTVAHAHIRTLMEKTMGAVSAEDPHALRTCLDELSFAVSAHEEREKRKLLPMLQVHYPVAARLTRAVRDLLDP